MREKDSVPAIRFVGFTDDWEQRKVFESAEIVAGGTPSTGVEKYWNPKEIPWLSSGEVHKKNVTFTDNMISREGLSNSSARMIRENSVLIALAGQGKTRGTVAINRIPLTTNQSIAAMTFKEDVIPEFIFYNLENRYDEIRKLSSGDGSRGGLNKQLVGDIVIPYTSTTEQEKIGVYFTHLENFITLHQRKCLRLCNIKKSMLERMFPGEGATVPEIRFAGFTDAWEQRKLSMIIAEKLSNGVINKSGTDGSNVKHINVINMYTSDRIHIEDLAPSSYEENTIQKCNVEVGDIFMTRSSLKPEGIAEANVLLDSGRFVFDDHLMRMKVDKLKYDPMFVKINLGNRMIKTQFIMKSKTTAFTTIGQEDISECEGMFPCLEEQKKIGEYFQNIDHLITLHQRKLERLQNIKKACLEKMFV